jgi:hypothetical protein
VCELFISPCNTCIHISPTLHLEAQLVLGKHDHVGLRITAYSLVSAKLQSTRGEAFVLNVSAWLTLTNEKISILSYIFGSVVLYTLEHSRTDQIKCNAGQPARRCSLAAWSGVEHPSNSKYWLYYFSVHPCFSTLVRSHPQKKLLFYFSLGIIIPHLHTNLFSLQRRLRERGTGGSFPRVKARLGRDADHSPPSRNYTSSPPKRVYGVQRYRFTFNVLMGLYDLV